MPLDRVSGFEVEAVMREISGVTDLASLSYEQFMAVGKKAMTELEHRHDEVRADA